MDRCRHRLIASRRARVRQGSVAGFAVVVLVLGSPTTAAAAEDLPEDEVRSGASTTKPLLDALAPLRAAGATLEEAAMSGFGRFPVFGEATYTHDWLLPRFGPGWRLHQGTDIFAPAGTPVGSPADGRVRISNRGLGGIALYVTEADGTYYYLAHLAGVAEGLADGDSVTAGQVIGYNGSSGNAQGTPPHVHFEVGLRLPPASELCPWFDPRPD